MKNRISVIVIAILASLGLFAAGAVAGGGFSDVPNDHPHVEGIDWASSNGVVQGYSDGTFRPDENVTRGQLATMLQRYDAQQSDVDSVICVRPGAPGEPSVVVDCNVTNPVVDEEMYDQWCAANPDDIACFGRD